MSATPAAVGPAAQRSIPAPAAGIVLLGAMRGSGYRSAPSLVRRRDGQTLQLTPLLYAVLAAIDGRRDHRQLAAAVSAEVGRPLTPEDTEYLVEEKLRPLGVLRRSDGTDPETSVADPLLALRWKYEVTDPERTARITRPFAALFRPWVVAVVMAAFAAVVVEVLFRRGLAGAVDEAFHDPRALLLVVGLTVLSTGFHEFGHAAACRYGGATPGAMGAGIYLVWPAFYTEVTDSYRLGRGGRLRVDLGGLYFNAVFAVAVYGAWAATGADALLLLVAAQVLQMVRQLTPLVRFDGYHILADLTGVPDLFQHIAPTLLGLLPSRWGDPGTKVLRPWARAVVTVWVLIVVPVLALTLGALVVLLPRLVATAWDGIGAQRDAVASSLAAGETAAAMVGVLAIVTLALPVLSIAYLLLRIVRRTARRVWRAVGDHPVRRLGALSAALFAAAAIAVVWWPQGQYEPVTPAERGTLQDLVAAELRPAGTGDVEVFRVEGTPLGDAPPLLVADDGVDESAAVLASSSVPVPDETAATGTEEPEAVSAARTRPAWPFAWDPPPEELPGDNRAWAVNTRDGSAVRDVTIASEWVTDGGPVLHRNEAWALASCVDCSTLAVAFQALFIVGGADEVAPVNASVATNDRCERCATHAVARQLVLTLERLPDPPVRARIARVIAELEGLHGTAHRMRPDEIDAVLAGAADRIATILADADLLALPADGSGTGQEATASLEDEPHDILEPVPEGDGVPEADAEEPVAAAVVDEEPEEEAVAPEEPVTAAIAAEEPEAEAVAPEEPAEGGADDGLGDKGAVDEDTSDDGVADEDAADDDTTGGDVADEPSPEVDDAGTPTTTDEPLEEPADEPMVEDADTPADEDTSAEDTSVADADVAA